MTITLNHTIVHARDKEDVALSGFGRFKLSSRAARQGRNPATGETIEIPASTKLAFTVAKSVRDALNNGTSGNRSITKASLPSEPPHSGRRNDCNSAGRSQTTLTAAHKSERKIGHRDSKKGRLSE